MSRASQPDEEEPPRVRREDEVESARPPAHEIGNGTGRLNSLERESMEQGNDLADQRFRLIRIETMVKDTKAEVGKLTLALSKLSASQGQHARSKAPDVGVVGVIGIVVERVMATAEDPKIMAHPQSLVVLLLALVAMLYTRGRNPVPRSTDPKE